MFPRLKTVGVAWNPAESNSVGFVGQARKAGRNYKSSFWKPMSIIHRASFERLVRWLHEGPKHCGCGDDTILSALNSVLSAAKKARIPAFGISPGDPERGTILDLGANFHEIGKLTGKLAVDMIRAPSGSDTPA